MKLTKKQQESLFVLFRRDQDSDTPKYQSYLQFRRSSHFGFIDEPVVFVKLFGIWFGIETDGYTHT